MQVIKVSSSGQVVAEEWSFQKFHSWRLGLDGGEYRNSFDLDFSLEMWVSPTTNQNDRNILAEELIEKLTNPMSPPRMTEFSYDILICNKERSGLSEGQKDLIMLRRDELFSNRYQLSIA